MSEEKKPKVGLKELAKRAGVPYMHVRLVVDVIRDALVAGESVQLTNFGSFARATLSARTFGKGEGETPFASTPVTKDERDTVRFKISDSLRAKIDPSFSPRWKRPDKPE